MNSRRQWTGYRASALLLVIGCAVSASAQKSHRQTAPTDVRGTSAVAEDAGPRPAPIYAKRHSPTVIRSGPTRVTGANVKAINSQPVPPGHGWDVSKNRDK